MMLEVSLVFHHSTENSLAAPVLTASTNYPVLRLGLVLLNSLATLNNKSKPSYQYISFEAMYYVHMEYLLLYCPQTITEKVRSCATAELSL